MTLHVTSAGVTESTDHVTLPEYPSVVTLRFVPHSALATISLRARVVEPPVMEPQEGERSTAVWMMPPEHERKGGQGS